MLIGVLSTLAGADAAPLSQAVRERLAYLNAAVAHAERSEQQATSAVDALNAKRQAMIIVYLQLMTEQAPIMLQDRPHFVTYTNAMQDDYGVLVRQIVNARNTAKERTTLRKSLERQRNDILGQQVELPSQD